MQRQVTILGVRFTDLLFDEAVEKLARAAAGRTPRSVFIANASTLNHAARDPAYRRTLNAADLTLGDGTGVRWAARLRRRPLQANLNGTDLVPALIARTPGIRVFLLGGTQATAGAAATKFAGLFPHAHLAGWHHGYFDHARPAEIFAEINRSRPHLVLVGFGNPLQERFIAEHRAAIDAPLVIGVGGLFGFWAGSRRRASSTLRRAGMEWLHILLTEKGKARRYILGNPAFLLRMVAWLPSDCLS
ncbi:MAG: WecB/TagA/CpsF family glycosyltransferase [Rhizobiaceae bacterium]|nr:WecB/TagA/CpsF family glycosyltransferase [Rhizobiaceae bacterium]